MVYFIWKKQQQHLLHRTWRKNLNVKIVSEKMTEIENGNGTKMELDNGSNDIDIIKGILASFWI